MADDEQDEIVGLAALAEVLRFADANPDNVYRFERDAERLGL